MTTYYDFTPSVIQPFSFQPTLDGNVYSCIVTWNLSGQRWYLSCADLYGNLIFSRAMVGSPIGNDINLGYNYFTTSTIVYRVPNGQIEVSP